MPSMNPGRGGKAKVTTGYQPSYSPDGKKVDYTMYKGNATGDDIYTINVGGGGKFRVTHNKADEARPSWVSRP
jgi:Tol biopolymer transport system component